MHENSNMKTLLGNREGGGGGGGGEPFHVVFWKSAQNFWPRL